MSIVTPRDLTLCSATEIMKRLEEKEKEKKKEKEEGEGEENNLGISVRVVEGWRMKAWLEIARHRWMSEYISIT